MDTRRRTLITSLAAAPLALRFGAASAQQAAKTDYPTRPVRIIVPYPPGGFNDLLARLMGKNLGQTWNQPFIVENKPGSGTVVGTDYGLRATPDGYTLTIASFPTVVNQFLYKHLPYDTNKAIAPIIVAGATPNLLVVGANSPITSMKDLIAQAKANPGKINYASSGVGTSMQLAMEYFKNVTGTDIVQIPYNGSAPMVTALLAGQVNVMFDNYPNVLPLVKAGKMRALAISSSRRSTDLPEVPTVAEQGYPGFEVSPWYGFMAPTGTPQPILEKLNTEMNRILARPDIKELFAAQGVMQIGGSLTDFERYFLAQSKKWEPVIKQANITLG